MLHGSTTNRVQDTRNDLELLAQVTCGRPQSNAKALPLSSPDVVYPFLIESPGDLPGRNVKHAALSGGRTKEYSVSLLAVDLGLRTGLSLYGRDGRLVWYRSQNFVTPARMKRGVHGLLNDLPHLSFIVVEGGGKLAPIWEKEALRRKIPMRLVSAETWRRRLLYPREQRTGTLAKKRADDLARRVIVWSQADRPTSLRHDAAEAILAGLWGVLDVGWLESLPAELRR